MGQLSTLGRSGHVVTKWKVDAPETVDEARVKFDEMMGKGFAAFQTIAVNEKVQIREFDETADEIVMVPQLQGG